MRLHRLHQRLHDVRVESAAEHRLAPEEEVGLRVLVLHAGEVLLLRRIELLLAGGVGVEVAADLIDDLLQTEGVALVGRLLEELAVMGGEQAASVLATVPARTAMPAASPKRSTPGRGLRLADKNSTPGKLSAGKNGGGLYVNGLRNQPAQVLLERVRFVQNHAGSEGGGANFNGYVQARLSECGLEIERYAMLGRRYIMSRI